MSRREKRKLERIKKRKQRKKVIKCLLLITILIIGYNKITKNNTSKINIISEERKPKKETTMQQMQNETQEVVANQEYELVTYSDESANQYIIDIYSNEYEEVKQIIEKYIKAKNLSEENFGFFYYNPNSKEHYFYNTDTYFTAASTIKVPLAILYYDKINNGEISKQDTLLYKAEDYEEGSGTTSSRYKPGNYIPISFLLEQMIVNSDNTATQILKSGLGENNKTYRNLITEYSNRTLKVEFYIDNITTSGYGYDVIKHIWDNQEKYSELIEYMKKSSGGGYLKKGITTCEIAHKYGSYEGNVHDYGIVYANNPYLIGIFTKGISNAEDFISEINKEILKLHE